MCVLARTYFCEAVPEISQFLLDASVLMNVISFYVSLWDDLRWESIWGQCGGSGERWGGRCAGGWRESLCVCVCGGEDVRTWRGGGVNIAPGRSLGPLGLLSLTGKTSLLKRLTVELIQCMACLWRAVMGFYMVRYRVVRSHESTCGKHSSKHRGKRRTKLTLYFWNVHVRGVPLSTENEATVGNICLFPSLADKLHGRWRESFMICSTQLYDNKPLYWQDCMRGRGMGGDHLNTTAYEYLHTRDSLHFGDTREQIVHSL